MSRGVQGASSDAPEGLYTLLSVGIEIIADGFVTHHPPCVPWCDVCYSECSECGLRHATGQHATESSQREIKIGTDFGTKTTTLRFGE